MAYVISELNLERQKLLGKVLAPVTDRLLSALQLRSGVRGLDLGCGMGETTRQLARALDKPNEIVRLGLTKTRVSLHHKSPTALVDHFAIGVDRFSKEAMTRYLKQHGLNPEENIDAGFHVKDPEGIRVQIVQAG